MSYFAVVMGTIAHHEGGDLAVDRDDLPGIVVVLPPVGKLYWSVERRRLLIRWQPLHGAHLVLGIVHTLIAVVTG